MKLAFVRVTTNYYPSQTPSLYFPQPESHHQISITRQGEFQTRVDKDPIKKNECPTSQKVQQHPILFKRLFLASIIKNNELCIICALKQILFLINAPALRKTS